MASGGPRGFWAAGDRWVAHAGALEDISIVSEHPRDSRFQVILKRAGRLFNERIDGASARIFGGFSFSPDHRAEDSWSAFPNARFHLPRIEVQFHPDEQSSRLTVRDRDPAAASETADRWSQGLVSPSVNHGHRGFGRPFRQSPPVAGWTGREPTVGRSRFTGIGPRAWARMVNETLSRIRAGEADKVVLARTLDVAPDEIVGPAAVAAALWQENHGSHVFLFEPVPGQALVGAAPERVATLSKGLFRATAVAGSVAVGTDSIETAQLGRRLFASSKDRSEHDFVVKDMVARMTALGCDVRRDVEPHVLTLARIQHLETKIAADVPAGVSLLDILGALHPTPAVCGYPRNAALSILTENEVFARGWYAGPVGWLDSEGGGIFVPALRSAVRWNGKWRMFAGAGIVPGSDAVLEWEETEIKFHPVLRAMVRAGLCESVLAAAE